MCDPHSTPGQPRSRSPASPPSPAARSSLSVSLLLLGSLSCALAITPLYSVLDLGTLGGAQSSASAINNLGQVAGTADLTSTSPVIAHAFIYSNGVMADLGALGAYTSGQTKISRSAAYAINGKGDIVGNSSTTNGDLHAFLFTHGQMSDLGVLPGSQQSTARAINDSEQVVGWSLPAGPQHAFLYQNGSMTDLGTLGGTASFAYGINNDGLIVGDSWLDSSGLSDTAFIVTNNTMTALGSLGTQPAIQAFALNDYNQVVGYAGAVSTGGPSVTRGFIFSNGSMTDLGDLGGALTNVVPKALNNHGQVVGTVSAYQGPFRAFVYSGGVITDLNHLIPSSSGWTLAHANGINDNGQIVGSGQNPAGQTHAFLLTPGLFPHISLTATNTVLIEFTAQANSGSTVEYSDTPSGGTWHLLALLDPVPFIHDVLLTDPLAPDTPRRFYRVSSR